MNKRIKRLIDNLMYVLNSELLKKIAIKTKFLKKDSKFIPEKFISLCVFSNNHLCENSLEELSTWLRINENLSITKQGVNARFNNESVEFLKSLFSKLMMSQSKLLSHNERHLKSIFNRIDICDGTSYKAPEKLKEHYEGNSGNGTDAIVKIQFEYNLLSGEFWGCKIVDAGESDFAYIPNLENNIEKNDLKLKDLGYFKVNHLEYIDKAEAFYISRVKTTTGIYEKIDKKYSKLDLTKYSSSLTEGETIEIPEVYLGAKEKLKTRIIVTKLTKESKEKKLATLIKNCKRKGRKVTDLAIKSSAINVYVTNVPVHMLSTEIIHEIYSLRWQIEIMFKIWKSVFQIHVSKPVKIERFNCHLYGKFIAILLSNVVVFVYRDEIYHEHGKQLSEYKAFGIVKSLLFKIKQTFFNNEFTLLNLFQLINEILLKNAIKSRRKGKKTSLDIIEAISETFIAQKVIA
jgi:hypothetical protein